MLKKLRIKFVAIIMASVAVVLAIVFTGICISEYQRSMASVEEALASAIDRASENSFDKREPFLLDGLSSGEALDGLFSGGGPGDFPSNEVFGESGSEVSGGEAASSGEGVENAGGVNAKGGRTGDGQFAGPRIGGMRDDDRSLVPVAVYTLDTYGTFTVVSGYTTALIEDDVLESASAQVTSASDGAGEISAVGLVYQKRTVESVSYVAFADAAYTTSWQSLAITLGIAGACTLLVFFVIALFLSKWALRPVEEAWTSQRQFVADASHELKTPLTVVLANTSILLKHPESSIASQSQWIESTQVEAESMQGLVNEMLELAQVESRAGIQHAPVDFSDLVDGETLQFESVAFERGCRFEAEVAPGVTVSGDAQRLRKMTSTLIENALKYVDEGGEVDVNLTSAGGSAKLAIRNTGSTISPEDLPHIFDRFYRTDKARTSGAGGFGLGLAIARETAREHGGDIVCDSGESGTTFTVTLPTQ